MLFKHGFVTSALALGLVLFVTFDTGEAVQCYQCSSENNQNCEKKVADLQPTECAVNTGTNSEAENGSQQPPSTLHVLRENRVGIIQGQFASTDCYTTSVTHCYVRRYTNGDKNVTERGCTNESYCKGLPDAQRGVCIVCEGQGCNSADPTTTTTTTTTTTPSPSATVTPNGSSAIVPSWIVALLLSSLGLLQFVKL